MLCAGSVLHACPCVWCLVLQRGCAPPEWGSHTHHRTPGAAHTRYGGPIPTAVPLGLRTPAMGVLGIPSMGIPCPCRALCHVGVTFPEAPRGRAVGGGAARSLIDFPSRGGAGFPWKPSHPPAPTPAGPGNAAGGALPAPPPRGGSPRPGRRSAHPPVAGTVAAPRRAQRAAALIRGSV